MNIKEIIYKKFEEIKLQKINTEILLNNILKNKKINKDILKKTLCENNKLNYIIELFNKWKNINNEINNINEFLYDKEIGQLAKEELNKNIKLINEIENKLNNFLYEKDNINNKGCFLEIKIGTGGHESSLFIKDLLKMYIKYAENKFWNIEIINKNLNDKKEYKDVILKISNKESYDLLKYESGGHRVQRVPQTESQGRIHTSTCIIAVMPVLNEKKYKKINCNDIKIDTFKSSGAGGQHVNTTDSAIRITHIPTGLVVACQDERSQHKNKSKALSVLESKLFLLKENEIKSEKNYIKKKLLGSGNRSDKIRTYNFSKNRITDHRISFSINKLHEILNGNLDILINKIINKV